MASMTPKVAFISQIEPCSCLYMKRFGAREERVNQLTGCLFSKKKSVDNQDKEGREINGELSVGRLRRERSPAGFPSDDKDLRKTFLLRKC